MIRNFLVLSLAAFATITPTYATTFGVDFAGIVYQTQGATGQAVGNTVTGHFDLDDVTRSFLNFTIAGQSATSGFTSNATIVPARTDAIYTAQISPVATGGSINSTFTLNLSAITNWPAIDTAFTLLADTPQLTNNLAKINNAGSAFPSTFNYYIASASGTNVTSLSANLTSITATVPEPASFTLLGSSLLALGFLMRRRV